MTDRFKGRSRLAGQSPRRRSHRRPRLVGRSSPRGPGVRFGRGFFIGWFVTTLGLTYLILVFGIASGFEGLAIGGALAFLFIRLAVPYSEAEARQHGE
jgi:hypothetical protein